MHAHCSTSPGARYPPLPLRSPLLGGGARQLHKGDMAWVAATLAASGWVEWAWLWGCGRLVESGCAPPAHLFAAHTRRGPAGASSGSICGARWRRWWRRRGRAARPPAGECATGRPQGCTGPCCTNRQAHAHRGCTTEYIIIKPVSATKWGGNRKAQIQGATTNFQDRPSLGHLTEWGHATQMSMATAQEHDAETEQSTLPCVLSQVALRRR